MDHYSKAQAELAQIDAQIAALQQRRESLLKFIDLGRSLFGDVNYLSQMSLASTLQAGVPGLVAETQARRFLNQEARNRINWLSVSGAAASRDAATARDRMLVACAEHIEANGPTHTRDLVTALETKGVEIGGADKLNTLSVALSKSGRFVADRKIGWSMATANEEPPTDAPTSTGAGVEDIA